jgi:hypothetical protein
MLRDDGFRKEIRNILGHLKQHGVARQSFIFRDDIDS